MYSCVEISTDGYLDYFIGKDPHHLAYTTFKGFTSVVSLMRGVSVEQHPLAGLLDLNIPLIGIIHDMGRTNGMPVNFKAWGLYGRSQIHGPMFVAYDGAVLNRPDLPNAFVDALRGDDFPPPLMLASMHDLLEP